MAHEASVQALQQIEQNFQHVIDLLNQADQNVREAKVANVTFGEAHNFNKPHGHALDDAISSIEKVLGEATAVHNEAMARLREAQAHASTLESESAESESTG